MNEIKTSELISAVTTSLDEAVDKYEESLDGMKARIQELETNTFAGVSGKSFGAPRTASGTFMKSGRLAELKEGRKSTGSVHLGDMSIKSLTSLQGNTDSPQSGINVVPNEAPGLWGYGRRNLRLIDVLPSVVVASNSLRYTRLQNWTNAAGAQPGEGGDKPLQNLAPITEEAPIETIAVIQKVSRQVMDDAGWLSMALDALMRYSLADELERQLLTGDGVNFTIKGLNEHATTITGSTNPQPDQIGAMIAEAQGDGYSPTFLVVHPEDFQAWRQERSAQDGQYVSGSWSVPNPPVIWGVDCVLSAAQERGEVLAVHAPSVALLDRQQPAVEVFEQNEDDVRKNLLTIRAELRAGLAVMDPAGVRKLELL